MQPTAKIKINRDNTECRAFGKDTLQMPIFKIEVSVYAAIFSDSVAIVEAVGKQSRVNKEPRCYLEIFMNLVQVRIFRALFIFAAYVVIVFRGFPILHFVAMQNSGPTIRLKYH